jgi:hypothetical protein
MEQAPGPLGSPQLPQAPPPEGAHPPVAPTPNEENCFSSVVAWHFGHVARADPWSKSSKR